MVLPIVVFGHDALRRTAVPVDDVARVQDLVKDMMETLQASGGVGLAANQVNRTEAVIIVAMDGEAIALINPKIVERRGLQPSEEGCLSMPEVYATIERAAWVRVQALSVRGEEVELEAEGLVANIIQHEIDHLEGRLFTDYVSAVRRITLKSEMQRVMKQYPEHVRHVEARDAQGV